MTHPLIRIAEEAVRGWVRGETPAARELAAPWAAPRPVFVTLRGPGGVLRGCIGHLEATHARLSDEVRATAVLAASEDPRFPAVEAHELDGLTYEISVLEPAEPVTDRAALDPRRYGVVVTNGERRGVLLPDLDGVDSVEQQLDIARRKAGIARHEPLGIERFRVTKVQRDTPDPPP